MVVNMKTHPCLWDIDPVGTVKKMKAFGCGIIVMNIKPKQFS